MKYLISISILFSIISYSAFSLQNQEENGAVKCGTFSPQIKERFNNKEVTLYDNTREYDLLLSEKFVSPKGKFMIHYAIEGTNKVPLEDKNKNGIPDYIDSVAFYFDFAHTQYVDIMGYKEPPTDGKIGGGEDLYDVYILDLGNDPAYFTYGLTFDDKAAPQTGAFPCKTSFIYIDNDYSPEDHIFEDGRNKYIFLITSGINAMKISAVHEYFHAVQFGIGTPPYTNYSSFMEMTATFMEYRFFPEIPDYFQYVNTLFKDVSVISFGNGYYENGYKWSIFFQKLHKKFGDEVMKSIWSNINKGMNPYLAMETALTDRNSSLYSELEDIALWIYYTNKNTIVENNYFDRAADFPILKYTYDENFSKPSVLISAFMEPLAFYPFRVQFLPESSAMSPDTLIGFLLNKDLANAYTQAMNNKRDAEVSITERENSAGCDLSIINNNYCIEKNHPDSELAMILIERLGTNIINDELVFPNPLVLGEDDYLAFPVDYNVKIGKKAELTIYSTENYKMYYKTIEVGIKEKHKTITWTDFPEDFSTGVYFYTIVIDDKKTYGKFAVKNRK